MNIQRPTVCKKSQEVPRRWDSMNSQLQVIINLLYHKKPWMHARKAGAKSSIIKDWEFDECRKMLNRRAIRLREEGLGKREMKADVLTMEEEEKLWRKNCGEEMCLEEITQLAWTIHCVFWGITSSLGQDAKPRTPQTGCRRFQVCSWSTRENNVYGVGWRSHKNQAKGIEKDWPLAVSELFATGSNWTQLRLMQLLPALLMLSIPNTIANHDSTYIYWMWNIVGAYASSMMVPTHSRSY